MPAAPAVGMTYHPEALPGIVYETDVVKSLNEPGRTPDGAIKDGLLIEETLMDGTVEYKVYAIP
jgi:hypothetical protein